VVSPTEPLSTRALLAQQQRERELAEQIRREEEAAKKETAPESPEPSRKRKR